MQRSWTTMMVSGMVAVACLSGCSANVKKANAMLAKENEELRLQISDRNAALSESQTTLREKDLELAKMRTGGGSEGGDTGFEQIPGVKATAGPGQVTVAVESDVLFNSGKAALKETAKKSLDQVASVLKSGYTGRRIRVEGFTDTDPIKKSGFKTNYHLGFERAYAVREYLVSRGVDAKRVSLASYGPDEPAKSKAESRRVEIVVFQ